MSTHLVRRARRRVWLFAQWKGKCAYCDLPADTEDHVIPKSAGGPDTFRNLVAACRRCNQAKDSYPLERFLAHTPKRLARIRRWLDSLPPRPPYLTVETEGHASRSCRSCAESFLPSSANGLTNKKNQLLYCSYECYQDFKAREEVCRGIVLERFGAACAYCAYAPGPRREHYLTLDFLNPKAAEDGSGIDCLAIDNLAPACEPCAEEKGLRTVDAYLADRPETLSRIRSLVCEEVFLLAAE